MLQIIIPAVELFDDRTQEFTRSKEQVLQLEHSLVSLSKWESKWCKPFLSKEPRTNEEAIDYIRCMSITRDLDPSIFSFIPASVVNQVSSYIDLPMTATTFSKNENQKINKEVITAEIIYYWMIALTIPFECQKWHLNRLLTLINVCNIKNQPTKKSSRNEILSRHNALNQARRAKLNPTG